MDETIFLELLCFCWIVLSFFAVSIWFISSELPQISFVFFRIQIWKMGLPIVCFLTRNQKFLFAHMSVGTTGHHTDMLFITITLYSTSSVALPLLHAVIYSKGLTFREYKSLLERVTKNSFEYFFEHMMSKGNLTSLYLSTKSQWQFYVLFQ